MKQHPDMDFYQEKDETAFLESWEAKHGVLETEEQLEELYKAIAADIDGKIGDGTLKLGDLYSYREVTVGYCDYNAFNHLYLFSQDAV